uniref:Uncharacterized protein n=1 Tax=Timema cristinae TaxID=61476 RepID=A0A7R9CWG0_TIMCR|nr:unnamed protein product [Timema cristinae]
MLLGNMDTNNGLCNVTRLTNFRMHNHVLDCSRVKCVLLSKDVGKVPLKLIPVNVGSLVAGLLGELPSPRLHGLSWIEGLQSGVGRVPLYNAICYRFLSITSSVKDSNEGWLSKLLVRRIEPTKESHSRLLSDKEVIYELQTHNVKPDSFDKYIQNW